MLDGTKGGAKRKWHILANKFIIGAEDTLCSFFPAQAPMKTCHMQRITHLLVIFGALALSEDILYSLFSAKLPMRMCHP